MKLREWYIFMESIFYAFMMCQWLLASNWVDLTPSDTKLQHKSGSAFAQVMACCLTAPSHHLNQCWLLTDLWSSVTFTRERFHRKFQTRGSKAAILNTEFENYTFEITATSPRAQWVNTITYYYVCKLPTVVHIRSEYIMWVLASANMAMSNRQHFQFFTPILL